MNDKKEFVAYLQKKYKDLSEEKLKLLQESGLLEKDYKEFLKSKKLKALHGAKLNYIKSLKNQCAEDEELYYYKKGGRIGCGCKKKEDGGKVIESAQNGAVAKFKSRPTKWTDKDERKLDSLSAREAKKQPITPQGKKDLKNLRDKFKKSSNKKDYELEEGKKGMKVEKDCGGSAVTKFKAACGSKLKKHQLGGSLNGIPFMQKGTPKGGLPTAPKAEDRYKGGTKEITIVHPYDVTKFGFRGTQPIRKVNSGSASISEIIRDAKDGTPADTMYYEIPNHLPFVNVQPRYAFSYGNLSSKYGFNPKFNILKRRFNTAWNLAK